jgi:hypothetical protein
VCDRVPIPITSVVPNHQADEIGARFAVPSELRVLMSTTGVPRYKMDGSIVRWLILVFGFGAVAICVGVILSILVRHFA